MEMILSKIYLKHFIVKALKPQILKKYTLEKKQIDDPKKRNTANQFNGFNQNYVSCFRVPGFRIK